MKSIIIKTRKTVKGNTSVLGFIVVGFFVLGTYKIYIAKNVSDKWNLFEKHDQKEFVGHVITYTGILARIHKNNLEKKIEPIGNYLPSDQSKKPEIKTIISSRLEAIDILHGFKRDSEETISVITNSNDK
jgi:hypothetical protein